MFFRFFQVLKFLKNLLSFVFCLLSFSYHCAYETNLGFHIILSYQPSAVSGQQSFSETESWIKSQGHKVARSQSDCLTDSATAYPRTIDRCLLSVDHPEAYRRVTFKLKTSEF